MTEPKRWSHPSSEVDPVLRSVVRYAQELGPDPAELQRLIRSTGTARKPPRVGLRRFATGMVLGLAAAFGGIAWAGYGQGWFSSAPTLAESGASALPAPAKPRARVAPSSVPSEAPVAVVPPLAPPAPVAALPVPSSDAVPPPSAASAQQDAELLQRARALVVSEPSRALSLTREHELHFPDSALGEERQALRIEALSRLGRRREAAASLEAFETRYPRSPYRRRLHALVAP